MIQELLEVLEMLGAEGKENAVSISKVADLLHIGRGQFQQKVLNKAKREALVGSTMYGPNRGIYLLIGDDDIDHAVNQALKRIKHMVKNYKRMARMGKYGGLFDAMDGMISRYRDV